MGQSNSEHSRHWFFGGKMVIDGQEKAETLFEMVKATLPKGVPNNSIIAFHDNSSAIRGYECQTLHPTSVDKAGPVRVGRQVVHPILTAETHNFPSAVAPFAGRSTSPTQHQRPRARGGGCSTVAAAGAPHTDGTVGEGRGAQRGEMFGERADTINEVKKQGREQLGEGHAGRAPAPLGHGGQDRAATLPEGRPKTARRPVFSLH